LITIYTDRNGSNCTLFKLQTEMKAMAEAKVAFLKQSFST